MKKRDKLFFYLSFYLCFISGAGLAIVKNFYQVESQYGIMPHPSLGAWLDLHLITLPFMIMSIGGLLVVHVLPHLRKKSYGLREYSGIILTIFMLISILSGQAIQVHFLPRKFFQAGHLISSLAILPVLLFHLISKNKSNLSNNL